MFVQVHEHCVLRIQLLHPAMEIAPTALKNASEKSEVENQKKQYYPLSHAIENVLLHSGKTRQSEVDCQLRYSVYPGDPGYAQHLRL